VDPDRQGGLVDVKANLLDPGEETSAQAIVVQRQVDLDPGPPGLAAAQMDLDGRRGGVAATPVLRLEGADPERHGLG
jgi:hypothetical protein